jgi:cytoskeletal protein CcmA (bactofilin family)
MNNSSSKIKENLKTAWANLSSGISKKESDTPDQTYNDQDEPSTVVVHRERPIPTHVAGPEETTIISKQTIINGSIQSDANVKIQGAVNGDVISKSSVMVTGSVEGDIAGKSVDIQSGKIVGNITSESNVLVTENSAIRGDIICDKLNLNGTVRGNVKVYSNATFGSSTVLIGNLNSQYLSIEEGAFIDGTVKVTTDRDTLTDDEYNLRLDTKPDYTVE